VTYALRFSRNVDMICKPIFMACIGATNSDSSMAWHLLAWKKRIWKEKFLGANVAAIPNTLEAFFVYFHVTTSHDR
jgi:hypothetical protein